LTGDRIGWSGSYLTGSPALKLRASGGSGGQQREKQCEMVDHMAPRPAMAPSASANFEQLFCQCTTTRQIPQLFGVVHGDAGRPCWTAPDRSASGPATSAPSLRAAHRGVDCVRRQADGSRKSGHPWHGGRIIRL
jgi:hypothetical protein